MTWTPTLMAAMAAFSNMACAPVCAIGESTLARMADNLDPIQLDVADGEVLAQARSFPGEVCYRDALRLALDLYATDDGDPESAAALLADHVRHLFAHPDSRLTLLARGQKTPRSESVAHAWIFVLSVPAFSDHLFYAVIGRQRDNQGRIHGYSYGYN